MKLPDARETIAPEELRLPLHLLSKDSAVLADLARFYWLNPDCRDELGNELALTRWAAAGNKVVSIFGG
jgi:hypothetical protein